MITFLFWNTHRNSVLKIITQLVHEHNVDVLILAESVIPETDLLPVLNRGQRALYFTMPGLSNRVRIYSRYLSRFIQPIHDVGGIAIRHLQLPLRRDILLVAVHLPSKLYQSESDQILGSTRLANIIESAEQSVRHSHTIVVGDLNMNPFENGIVGAAGLHAISDRNIVANVSRYVQGENRVFFYNPMWNYFGDKPPDPPGTYFYNTGKQINLYWNVFDQVLIRPDLLDVFDINNLEVITHFGEISLLDDTGKPNTKVASDHLPILFKLSI